jgi:MFS family permease
MLGMAAVMLTGGPILVLMALSVLAAGFSTFFYPAIGAYLPNLVDDERQLGPANSAWASLDNLGFVVGPVLGGLLVAGGGTTFAFLINAVTFVAIAVVLWGLPPSLNVRAPASPAAPQVPHDAEPTPEPPAPAALAPDPAPAVPIPPSGTSRIPLVGIAVIRSIDYLIYGGVGVLTVILATDILHAGEAATGYLNAAIGIGGVTGAIVSGALVLRRSLAVPVIAGAAVWPAAPSCSGWPPSWWSR